MFDQDHREFNDESVVLRHELGHVVSWLANGGAIGRMKLSREADGLLGSRMNLDTRNCERPLPVHLAERLLAGESAARLYLKMPLNVISWNGTPLTPITFIPNVLNAYPEPQRDVAKVLYIAYETAADGWYQWMQDRLNSSAESIREKYRSIDRIATSLEGRIPVKPNLESIITGFELISAIRGEGIKSIDGKYVEIVSDDEDGGWGNLRIRIRRSIDHRLSKSFSYRLRLPAP